MANQDSPFGLRPVRQLGGAYVTGNGNIYHVAALDAQVIAPGDPVIVTGESDTKGIPTVTRSTAGATERITGVMMSIANSEQPQLDGTGGITQDTSQNTVTLTDQYIFVADDPSIVYQAQFAGTLVVGDISSTANLTAGVAIEGKSTFEVGAVTGLATGQVRILRLVQNPNNEVGEFAKIEVIINLPTTANDLAGV